jgi:hypothetical protein
VPWVDVRKCPAYNVRSFPQLTPLRLDESADDYDSCTPSA